MTIPKLTTVQLVKALNIELERCNRIRQQCKKGSAVTSILTVDIKRAQAALEIGEAEALEEALTLLKGIRS